MQLIMVETKAWGRGASRFGLMDSHTSPILQMAQSLNKTSARHCHHHCHHHHPYAPGLSLGLLFMRWT